MFGLLESSTGSAARAAFVAADASKAKTRRIPAPRFVIRQISIRMQLRLRHAERDPLRRGVAPADGHDDVLLAAVHVRHRRARRAGGQGDRGEDLAALLVVST